MGCAAPSLLVSSRRARGRLYCHRLNVKDPSRLELGPFFLEHCVRGRGVWYFLLLPICGRLPACITKLHHTQRDVDIFFVCSDVTPVLKARLIAQTAVGLVRHCGSLTACAFSFQHSKCYHCKSAVQNLQVLAMQQNQNTYECTNFQIVMCYMKLQIIVEQKDSIFFIQIPLYKASLYAVVSRLCASLMTSVSRFC